MSITSLFGFGQTSPAISAEEMPDIFPIAMTKADFIDINVVSIYAKILTDVAERTHGLTDDEQTLLWDNCVKSNASDGLISLLSKAMAKKEDLYLVYVKDVGVIRKANGTEQATIKADYEKTAGSKVGIFISFKNYKRSDMVLLYSGLEFASVSSLNKTMNLANAVQVKMDSLRSNVSLKDSADVNAQALAIATGLSKGKDVLLDGKDAIVTASPDVTASKESFNLINQKLAFYLAMPASYITSEQSGGLGDSGEGDTKAVERGLKNYYYSIFKPVLEAIFNKKTISYKTQDFRQIGQALETVKTFELVSDEYVSKENKQMIINKMLELPDDAKGDPVEEQPALRPGDGSGEPKVAPIKPDPKARA